MNLLCLFGFHKWEEFSTFGGKMNSINTMKRCLRCGKEEYLDYGFPY